MSATPLHIGLLAADLTHKHGWAHYSLSLVNALKRAGVRVTIVASRNSPIPDGLSVVPILPNVDPLESGMLAGQARALARTRAALRSCDSIHAMIEPYAPLAALVAGHRPLVITGHGSYVRAAKARPAPIRLLYEWAFRRALVICVSRYTARAVEAALPGVRTEVINNGVDFDRFAPLNHRGGQQPTVLSVGALKERKGTLALVRAMAAVRERVPDAQCIIAGSLDIEPDYVAQVRAEIDALDLGNCVHLIGRVPEADLLRLYETADVFALPSLNVDWKFEGYGLVHLEASAAGLPVIGSRDCGAEDAIVDGVTGLLIPQEGVEAALADAITALLTDRERAARMGAAGRERARTQTWDHVAARMIATYRRLIPA